MRSSVTFAIFACLCATLSIASPLARVHDALHKRKIVYDIITDIVYVTVTDTDSWEPAGPTSSVVDTTTTTLPIVTAPVQTYAPVEISTSSTTSLSTTTSTSTTYVAPVPTSTYLPPIVATTSDTSVVSIPSVTESTSTPQDTAIPATNVAGLSSTAVTGHKTARASNQAAPLTWDDEIAQYAYEGSNCTIWGHNMDVGDKGYGQNVAMNGSSDPNAFTTESALQGAIESWFSEGSMYLEYNLYGQDSPNTTVLPEGQEIGHFTAMVWQNTTSVGCSVRVCGPDTLVGGYNDTTKTDGLTVWNTVCNYRSEGNIGGAYAANVLRPV